MVHDMVHLTMDKLAQCMVFHSCTGVSEERTILRKVLEKARK